MPASLLTSSLTKGQFVDQGLLVGKILAWAAGEVCVCRASSTKPAQFTFHPALVGLSTLWQLLGCLRPSGVQILGESLHSCKCRPPPAAAPRSFCAHPWGHRHERGMDPLTIQGKIATSASDFTQKILYQTAEFWVFKHCFQESVQYHLRTQRGGKSPHPLGNLFQYYCQC